MHAIYYFSLFPEKEKNRGRVIKDYLTETELKKIHNILLQVVGWRCIF